MTDKSIMETSPAYSSLDEIEEYMPHYVLYKKLSRKEVDCYCTYCKEQYIDSKEMTFGFDIQKYKHFEPGECACCGRQVHYMAMGYGRTSHEAVRNFAVMRAEENGQCLTIRCYKIYQTFDDENDLKPNYRAETITKYELRKGSAKQYFMKWEKGGWTWRERKTRPAEPNFWSRIWSYYSDREYTVIDRDELGKTFFKYVENELGYMSPELYITYLCRIAQHPNMEYLIKGGMRKVADQAVNGEGVRVNWKQNNMLKMLRINRTELKYLSEDEGERYKDYIIFRRDIYNSKNTQQVIEYFDKFKYVLNILIRLRMLLTKDISSKEIMDYIIKQDNKENAGNITGVMQMWADYINECNILKYDISDRAVIMPRDLCNAHDRTMKLIRIKESKEQALRMKASNKMRKHLLYRNEENDLQIILPKTVNDIVYEGKILSHCVGGYAERHAYGKLHILFLRKISDPDTPYYTIEVDIEGKIVQCHGYKNDVVRKGGTEKPKKILDFEKEYQKYLDKTFEQMKKKMSKKSA